VLSTWLSMQRPRKAARCALTWRAAQHSMAQHAFHVLSPQPSQQQQPGQARPWPRGAHVGGQGHVQARHQLPEHAGSA
jgi:hypothetical protein